MTNRDCYQASLVEVVESKPILYDKNTRGFKDEEEKLKAWNSVIVTLRGLGYDCNMEEVQNEWLRIRERYSRERKKLGQPDGGTNWELMPHLDFLEGVVRYRRYKSVKRKTLPLDAILSVSAAYDTFPKMSTEVEARTIEDQNACTNDSPAERDDPLSPGDVYDTPVSVLKRPKLYVPATSRQVTPVASPPTFSAKQRDGDALRETLNTYLSVVAEMSQNINTFLHNRTERTSTGSSSAADSDEESLRGFIMGFLPFWKAIALKDRATLMSSVTALFAEALHKSDTSQ